MNRSAVVLVGLLVLVLVGWYVLTLPHSKAPPVPKPTLAQDLYPLYNAVTWGAPQAESVTIGTTTYTGASVTSAVVPAGMNPAQVFDPFDLYYDATLKGLGWQVANDLAAGGHVGGQVGYRNGNQVILVRYHVDYHQTPADAPSECPCDVVLSLFSGS